MPDNKKVIKFLEQSNFIEREYSQEALEDAVKAWEYAYKNRHNVNLDYILKIHKLLMRRLNPEIAGKLRDCDVFIAGTRKIFVTKYILENILAEWLKKYYFLMESDPKKAHIGFENIHPFQDGNGRTGRILMAIHRINMGKPILIIHEGSEQKSYYGWFSDNKNIIKRPKHTEETKRKISISNTGEKSSQWKGDNIKYQAIHTWLRTRYGNANKCENIDCKNKSKEYQWALIKGKLYKRRRNHFIMLCRSCHRKMDITKETRKKISIGLTKYIGCSIKNCLNSHLSRGYCMNHYNTIYRKLEK